MVRRTSLLVTLTLATVVALGIGGAWKSFIYWGSSILSAAPTQSDFYEYLHVRGDGEVLISRYDANYDPDTAVTKSLDGEVVDTTGRLQVTLQGIQLMPAADVNPPPDPVWENRLLPYGVTKEPQLWYFVHNGQLNGSGYFIGYDSRQNIPLAYIGREGFRKEKPPLEEHFQIDFRTILPGSYLEQGSMTIDSWDRTSEPSSGRSYDSFYVATEGDVLKINTSDRTLRELATEVDAFAVGQVQTPLEELPLADEGAIYYNPQFQLLARTPDHLLLFDPGDSTMVRFQVPEVLKNRSAIYYMIDDETLLGHDTSQEGAIARNLLVWFDSDKVLREQEVILSVDFDPPNPQAEAVKAAIGYPAPIVQLIDTGLVWPWRYLRNEQVASFTEGVRKAYRDNWSWITVGITFSLGAILAGWVVYLQRRSDRSHTLCWVAFVFFAGAPGFLAYLFHRQWPVSLPCPECGCRTPLDRASCFRCSAEFPRPLANGSEVFA